MQLTGSISNTTGALHTGYAQGMPEKVPEWLKLNHSGTFITAPLLSKNKMPADSSIKPDATNRPHGSAAKHEIPPINAVTFRPAGLQSDDSTMSEKRGLSLIVLADCS